MATGPDLRIGDAEREAAATSLREHFAHGRLTMDEFQQRLDVVFAAKTEQDLAKVTRDLPHTSSLTGPWSYPGSAALAPGQQSTGNWPIGDGAQGSGRGGYSGSGQGSRSGRRSGSWAAMSMALIVVAVLLIAETFRPLGWLHALLPRPVLILVAALLFLGRMIRRVVRGRK